MSEEFKNKFRRLVDEAWNKGNLEVVEEAVSANYVEHHPSAPDVKGLEGFKQMIIVTRQAFPDFNLTIYDSIVDGNKFAVRWSWQGTHSGPLPSLSIPATGKKITVNGAHIFHHDGDKLIEGWQFRDDLALLQQLGISPR